MQETPIQPKQTLRERMQDIKDHIKPRKLGYYKIAPSSSLNEQLPEGQRTAQCYAPVTNNEQLQVDTLNYGAASIKTINRTMPDYKGLIFDAQLGSWDSIKQAMQLYANEYKLPCSTIFNGKIRTLQPEKEQRQINLANMKDAPTK